ncbi:hypothetical protein GGU10DRAFT_405228 [Lentinula aff. detonsa]|uniref:NAD-dependent epimerase/dehydratase domain-containing protein n=1 Tax=Lentinula aff. detonsa TaxID=2804958 RepID=A0AA38KMK0_9AGAR|nr:hypothetical protein GGU10DRAFT_405228 [Lentinula aff. detonsa]
MKSQRIAIAGGTGRIGRHIVESLLDIKHQYSLKIIVLSRSQAPNISYAGTSAPVLPIDYQELSSIQKTLNDFQIDTVISTLLALPPTRSLLRRKTSSARRYQYLQFADLLPVDFLEHSVSVSGETGWATQSPLNDETTIVSPISHQHAPHKFPPPSTAHIDLQTNIYSTQLDEDLKSGDVFKFYLLAKTIREVDAVYLSPLYYQLDTSNATLRYGLLSWIAEESLAGDIDAAEWVLLSSNNLDIHPSCPRPSLYPTFLVSRSAPSLSTAPLEPSMTLNTSTLYPNVLSLILPIIMHVPLSLPLLNDGVSEGAKDDPEDDVTEGEINDRSIRNLRALQEVIHHQPLEYVFPYSGFRFEIDTGFIVCTEGKKSVLAETHITIPLKPAKSWTSAELQQRLYKPSTEIQLPPSNKLEAWWKLVGGAITKRQTIFQD